MKNITYLTALALAMFTVSSCQKELTPTGYGQVQKKHGNLTVYSEVSNRSNNLDRLFNESKLGGIVITSGSTSYQDYLNKQGSMSISGGGQYNAGHNQTGIVSKFVIDGKEILGSDNPSQSISFGTRYELANFNTYHALFGKVNQFSIFGNGGSLLYTNDIYCPLPLQVSTVPAIQDITGRVEVGFDGSLKIYWNADPNNPDGIVYLILEDSEPYETSAPINIFMAQDDGEFTINGDILSQYAGKSKSDEIMMSVDLKRFNMAEPNAENSPLPRVVCINKSSILFFLR